MQNEMEVTISEAFWYSDPYNSNFWGKARRENEHLRKPCLQIAAYQSSVAGAERQRAPCSAEQLLTSVTDLVNLLLSILLPRIITQSFLPCPKISF